MTATAGDLLSPGLLDGMPHRSDRLIGYTRESVEAYMDSSPIHRIEGIWRFTATGATVAIERFSDKDRHPDVTLYRIVLLRTPVRTLMPGTIMGYIAPTAKRDTYDARIYTSVDGCLLTDPKQFTLTLAEDSRLSFKLEKKGISISFRRWLPYIFRMGIRQYDTRDASMDGCLKIYPTAAKPSEPIYL